MRKAVKTQPDTPRHKPKKAARRRPVSAAVREQIIELASLGKTHSEIAKQLGRSQHTIRGVLRTPEARQHREKLRQAMAEAVRCRMIAGAERAVDSWAQQLELANDAQRANHLPAKDWLTHAGVVGIPSPKKDATPEVVIEFGCCSHDEIEFIEAPVDRADVGLPKTIRLSPEDLPPDDEPVEDAPDDEPVEDAPDDEPVEDVRDE